MLYRPYKPEDFPELYRVEETCFVPPFRFSRSYIRQIIDGPNSATWIAEENGSIAGFAVIEWTGDPSPQAYIQTIEVLPEFRGMGAAGELMRRLEKSAIEAGAGLIWLHVDAENHAAIRLYEKERFVLHRREANYYPRGRDALVYRKLLAHRGSWTIQR